MVVPKINHFIWLGWFLMFFSCKTQEKNPELQYFVHKNAGYVLLASPGSEWASHPDAWTGFILSSNDRKLFQQLGHLNGIVNFLISPDQNVRFIAVYHHPDTTQKINIPTSYVSILKKHLLFISNDTMLLNDFASKTNQYLIPKEKAEKYYHACNADALIHWYIIPEHIPYEKFYAFHPAWLFRKSGSVYVWDKEIPSTPLYSGISFPADTLADLSSVFNRVEPSSFHPAFYLTQETESFLTLKFNSFPVFQKQWKEFKTMAGYRDDTHPGFLKSLKSIAFARATENYAVGLFSEEPTTWTDRLQKMDQQNQMIIYKNTDSSYLSRIFYPLVPKISYPYVGVVGSLVIWAQSPDFIKKVANQIWQDKVLMVRKSFQQIHEMAGDDNHIISYHQGTLYFARATEKYFLNGVIQEHTPQKIKGTNGKINQSEKTSISYKTYLTRKISGEFILEPRWIFNHRTGKYEILFQDHVKRLKLTDALGNKRWSKSLDTSINSDIFQVDMFKNRKRQFVFSTPTALYLTDILGNHISPFPVDLNISAPVAVFDYDKNKNYRIAVPLEDKVVLYNIEGKIIKDFKSPKLTGKLQHAPQHIRIGTKDYILLQQIDGTLHIIDRRGNPRIRIKDKIQLKTGQWFKHQNKFTALTTDGKIINISTDGKITFPYPDEKNLTQARFTNRNRFTTDGKKLYYNGKPLSLPEGEYDRIQLYYLNGKEHWAAFDSSTQTAYILMPGNLEPVVRKFSGMKLLDLIKRRNTYYAIVTDKEGNWKIISFKEK